MSYACTNCGSRDTSVFRDSQVNPLLLCGGCGFKFHMEDSIEAEKAGELPDEQDNRKPRLLSKDEQDKLRETNVEHPSAPEVQQRNRTSSREPVQQKVSVPRSPSYVLVSKDRKHLEFATKKDIKKKVLRWIADERKFDCFELQPKQIEANIDI